MTPDVVVDVGNSRIKFKAFTPTGGPFHAVGAEPTPTWDRLVQGLEAYLVDGGRSAPFSWAISGVNPGLRDKAAEWLRARGDTVRVITSFSELPLALRVPHPEQIGIDRLLDVVGANVRRTPGVPAVVVDAGTAITINAVSREGEFVGGAITAGVRTMRKALHQQTAKLPNVDTISDEEFRAGLPATTTQAAIYWGTHWAAVGGIERLLGEVSAACGFSTEMQVFITGGDGDILYNGLRDRLHTILYDPLLTLEGIRIAAEALP